MLMDGQKIKRRKKRINIFSKELWERVFGKILDCVYPPRCFVCDGILDYGERGIHEKCKRFVYPVMGNVCYKCGKPVVDNVEYCFDCAKKGVKNKGFTQGKSLFVYKGKIKLSMYRFKYSNRREYAKSFSKLAEDRYREWIIKNKIDVIIPVPMYRGKERLRGYNQAEIFARRLSEITDIPVNTKLVLRIKDTIPMKNLSDIERKNNLKNAFQVNQNIVQYNYILLVDDIYTTGSTADAISEMMRGMGVSQVYFLSICIGQGF